MNLFLKQAFILLASAAFCHTITAQKIPVPTPVPDKPVPDNIRPLTPPDLKVEELSLVSVIRDTEAKKVNIQVLIRVKNTGQQRSGNSTIVGYVKIPASSGTERRTTTTLPITGINPGASFVKVFTFRETEAQFRSGAFAFWIKADAFNTVAESDETNNRSVTLTLDTPAR